MKWRFEKTSLPCERGWKKLRVLLQNHFRKTAVCLFFQVVRSCNMFHRKYAMQKNQTVLHHCSGGSACGFEGCHVEISRAGMRRKVDKRAHSTIFPCSNFDISGRLWGFVPNEFFEIPAVVWTLHSTHSCASHIHPSVRPKPRRSDGIFGNAWQQELPGSWNFFSELMTHEIWQKVDPNRVPNWQVTLSRLPWPWFGNDDVIWIFFWYGLWWLLETQTPQVGSTE